MRSADFRRRFWTVAGAASIRVKILGIVIGVTVTLGATVGVVMHRGLTSTLERELEQRGLVAATNLATRSEELILTDRLFTLYALAKETVQRNTDLLYVYVTDPQGHVLVHTFEGGMPADLLALGPVGPEDRVRIGVLNDDSTAVRSIEVPILAGRVGTVHLGMSENGLRATIGQQIRRIILATCAVLVLGIIAAFGVATILTRPLTQLAAAAENIGRGDFAWRPPGWARDEVGRLGSAFGRMADRLASFRDELRHRDEIRTRLLDQVMTAQEEERRRIARELHDGTGQALTSLTVGLTMIRDAQDVVEARARAAELGAQATRALDEVHNLARGLRPSVLDDLGLLAAVERQLKEYEMTHGIAVDLHASGFEGRRLPGNAEIAIYRIMQEALTNIAKHAHATMVSVLLEHREASVRLIVEDDGRGFDVDQPRSHGDAEHLGLHGMRERATLLGGTLTVESSRGRGTTVFAEIPVGGDG
jgi:signal transduction histidine kinase